MLLVFGLDLGKPNEYQNAINVLRKNSDIASYIIKEARKAGLDEFIALTIAYQESRLDKNAKNPNSTAGGLFQHVDIAWKQFGTGIHQDKFDPKKAVAAYIKQMKYLLNFYKGDQEKAIYGYAAGPWQKDPKLIEAGKGYARMTLRNKEKIKEIWTSLYGDDEKKFPLPLASIIGFLLFFLA